ncbi:roadblock/LC7 domain-containing protein [Nonomuraea fuscirosea]|uniref:roadblock/LC7 domain-containing protein n=1 Tax=Nonomuraea fuscirosea TaxID=1291556 RepID=UPI002DD8BCCC|nr:roadblock/LC7 domain-containing protein [Nonomuraea fuscirosea]WSA53468.1 roadblock/LC7 domain-containing protein [Nonomuraea fuscirosea]
MELRQEVLEEMTLLRERTPDVSGSVACTVDGLPIACDLESRTSEQVAALSAALLAMSSRMLVITGRGALEETLISGTAGFVAFYAAGPTIVLTVLAGPGANVGLLRLEGRKTAAAVAAVAARKH